MKNKELCKSISRNVIMASVLEPITEKNGCTTRSRDISPKTKLEYFLIAGINIGWKFFELAERIIQNDYKQPDCIYDLGYQAQVESFNNRHGGKINFGIIELFIPLITAQLVYQKGALETIELSTEVMKNTTKEDVRWHYKLRDLAKRYSSRGNDAVFIDVANVYEYFKLAPKVRENDQIWHSQIFSGFPLIKEVYLILEEEIKTHDLLSSSAIAYDKVLIKCANTPGIAADYICAAMYLFLCFNPEKKVI